MLLGGIGTPLWEQECLAGALAVGLLEGLLCPCQCVTHLTQSTVTSLVPLQTELSFNELFTFLKALCPVVSMCMSVYLYGEEILVLVN